MMHHFRLQVCRVVLFTIAFLSSNLYAEETPNELVPCPTHQKLWGYTGRSCLSFFCHYSRQTISDRRGRHSSQLAKRISGSVTTTDGDDDNDNALYDLRKIDKDEWIDGKTMKQILNEKRLKKQSIQVMNEFNSLQKSMLQKPQPAIPGTLRFVSRVSNIDANTLKIEIPPPGIDANVWFTGMFAALWFSAVAPATVSMIGVGAPLTILFMLPFWFAGGVVAKTAIYDPFVASVLTIGEYAWTIEKNYLRKAKTKREEGNSYSLRGSSVELVMLVNNNPKYELKLFDGDKTIGIGRGLDVEELEYLSGVINEQISECSRKKQ
mmetsp:Transcript_4563/g.10137  ORF Transcript_4563/g.10137 Transcript_4563/m.10137 type:complete len:322 (+) Transcript_4563:201-1166(+)